MSLTMNRRGFFARTFAALVAAVYRPKVAPLRAYAEHTTLVGNTTLVGVAPAPIPAGQYGWVQCDWLTHRPTSRA
jgi:hypothetical protein